MAEEPENMTLGLLQEMRDQMDKDHMKILHELSENTRIIRGLAAASPPLKSAWRRWRERILTGSCA